NAATELCITKGQEAVVVGWDSAIGPSGQRILDTLFVRLTNPPRDIQIPDLPLNVVPLARTSNHVTCLLRDDSLLSIMRDQVMVLPNFAMTDYASQGKGRSENVVHLNNSKNHQNYYVALSRGYTADGTCIVQGFDAKRITSGISGYLRQEFRELELLDEITRLRHEGRLPKRVTGIYRGQLLASYRAWKGNSADPTHFHPAIRTKLDEEDPINDYGIWKPTIDKSAGKMSAQHKRKASEHEDVPAPKKMVINATASGSSVSAVSTIGRTIQSLCPVGLIWDNTNYSCGYDGLLTPLAGVWRDNPELWTQRLTDFSPLLGLWANIMRGKSHIPEEARNTVRHLLHFQNPVNFPIGPRGIKLDDLFMGVTVRRSYGDAVTGCETCGYRVRGVTDTFSQYINVWNTNELRQRYPQVPSLIILSLNLDTLRLEEDVTLGQKMLKLRGLIYHSQITADLGHFTSVVVDAQGTMWYHDGMTTRRACTSNGRFVDLQDPLTLHRRGDQRLCAAIYAVRESG
ncbi:hypothetical protein B0H13DRAFT_1629001, partial [Mycena leptocephala]